MGRYRRERPALPALALTTNSSIVTALGNDYGYESVFARQVEALVVTGDLVVGISTSGRSPSVLEGLRAAKLKGAATAGMTGANGLPLAQLVETCLIVPSTDTARIQETHLTVAHIVCDLVERELFPPSAKA